MEDLTRYNGNPEKKSICLSVAEVKNTDMPAVDDYLVFILPENALIVNAGVIVEEAAQALATIDVGFDGGAQLGNDLAIDAVGFVAGAIATHATPILTGTGKNVTVKPSAVLTSGKLKLVCEYYEYTKKTGELTKIEEHTV